MRWSAALHTRDLWVTHMAALEKEDHRHANTFRLPLQLFPFSSPLTMRISHLSWHQLLLSFLNAHNLWFPPKRLFLFGCGQAEAVAVLPALPLSLVDARF